MKRALDEINHESTESTKRQKILPLEIFNNHYLRAFQNVIQGNNLWDIYNLLFSMFYKNKLENANNNIIDRDDNRLVIENLDIWSEMANVAMSFGRDETAHLISVNALFILTMNTWMQQQQTEISPDDFRRKALPEIFLHYAKKNELEQQDIRAIIQLIDSIEPSEQKRTAHLNHVLIELFKPERALISIPSAISILLAYPLKYNNLKGCHDLLKGITLYIRKNANPQSQYLNLIDDFLSNRITTLFSCFNFPAQGQPKVIYTLLPWASWEYQIKILFQRAEAARAKTAPGKKKDLIFASSQFFVKVINKIPANTEAEKQTLRTQLIKILFEQIKWNIPHSLAINLAIGLLTASSISQNKPRDCVNILVELSAYIKRQSFNLSGIDPIKDFVKNDLQQLCSLWPVSATAPKTFSNVVIGHLWNIPVQAHYLNEPIWCAAMQADSNTTEHLDKILSGFPQSLKEKNQAGLTFYSLLLGTFLSDALFKLNPLRQIMPEAKLTAENFTQWPVTQKGRKTTKLLDILNSYDVTIFSIILKSFSHNRLDLLKAIVEYYGQSANSANQNKDSLSRQYALTFLLRRLLNLDLTRDSDLQPDQLFIDLVRRGRADIYEIFTTHQIMPSTYSRPELLLCTDNSNIFKELLPFISSLDGESLKKIKYHLLKNSTNFLEAYISFLKFLETKPLHLILNDQNTSSGLEYFAKAYHLNSNDFIDISEAPSFAIFFLYLADLYWEKSKASQDQDRVHEYSSAINEIEQFLRFFVEKSARINFLANIKKKTAGKIVPDDIRDSMTPFFEDGKLKYFLSTCTQKQKILFFKTSLHLNIFSQNILLDAIRKKSKPEYIGKIIRHMPALLMTPDENGELPAHFMLKKYTDDHEYIFETIWNKVIETKNLTKFMLLQNSNSDTLFHLQVDSGLFAFPEVMSIPSQIFELTNNQGLTTIDLAVNAFGKNKWISSHYICHYLVSECLTRFVNMASSDMVKHEKNLNTEKIFHLLSHSSRLIKNNHPTWVLNILNIFEKGFAQILGNDTNQSQIETYENRLLGLFDNFIQDRKFWHADNVLFSMLCCKEFLSGSKEDVIIERFKDWVELYLYHDNRNEISYRDNAFILIETFIARKPDLLNCLDDNPRFHTVIKKIILIFSDTDWAKNHLKKLLNNPSIAAEEKVELLSKFMLRILTNQKNSLIDALNTYLRDLLNALFTWIKPDHFLIKSALLAWVQKESSHHDQSSADKEQYVLKLNSSSFKELFALTNRIFPPSLVNQIFIALGLNLYAHAWHPKDYHNQETLSFDNPQHLLYSESYRETLTNAEKVICDAYLSPLDQLNFKNSAHLNKFNLNEHCFFKAIIAPRTMQGYYTFKDLPLIHDAVNNMSYLRLRKILHFNPAWINAVEIDNESIKTSLLDKAINHLLTLDTHTHRKNFVIYCFYLIIQGLTATPQNYLKLIKDHFWALFYFAWQTSPTNFIKPEELEANKQKIITFEESAANIIIMNSLTPRTLESLPQETRQNYGIHAKIACESAITTKELNFKSANPEKLQAHKEKIWKKQFRMSIGILNFFPANNIKKDPSEPIECRKISLETNQLN